MVHSTQDHDDVIKWKHFPRYWPFVWGIHRSPVNSFHKGQWRGALVFSLSCTWTNGWVNNQDTGHLSWRHCNDIWSESTQFWLTHYTLMICVFQIFGYGTCYNKTYVVLKCLRSCWIVCKKLKGCILLELRWEQSTSSVCALHTSFNIHRQDGKLFWSRCLR